MNTYLKKFIDAKFQNPGKALYLGAGDLSDITYLKRLGWEGEGVDIKTGIDLKKLYQSKNKPFDLVYSNYLLHQLKNKKQLIQTAFANLMNDGWFFIHTFDQSDPSGKSNITTDFLKKLLEKQGFKNISTRIFNFYDDEEGHKHWHKILEANAQK